MLVVGNTQGQHTHTSSDWERADEQTVRLAPDAIGDLPAKVQEELTTRGCTIPQIFEGVEHSNVVRGRFTQADWTDIAVLCSRERVSSILVFRRGSAEEVDELASEPDVSYLQGIGNGEIGFSRRLGIASPEYIQYRYEALEQWGVPEPPPLDHDGIDDYFDGKASTIWYWYGGEWLTLAGAD